MQCPRRAWSTARSDLLAAAEGMAFPLLVKANIGGSGAGIVRYSSLEELRASIADRMVPQSVDQVLLVQDYVPPRGGTIIRHRNARREFSLRDRSRERR